MELELDVFKNWSAQVFHAEMIYSGERLGIFGPAGCGKSTLAQLVAGLVFPDQGKIALNGRLLEDVGSRLRVAPEQRNVSYVPENVQLFPQVTVYDNLLHGYASSPQARLTPAKVIRWLELEPLLGQEAAALSGSDQLRVIVGRAILGVPQLLILDEPVAALDMTVRPHTLHLIREACIAGNISYLYLSASAAEINLMADDVMLMEKGKIRERLLPEALAYRQERFYENDFKYAGKEARV
jgi:molybdate transport system ATP-binding protein